MTTRRSSRTVARQQPKQSNSTGLPALPLDVLGEIVSQLPEPLAIPPKIVPGLQNWHDGFRRRPRDSECFQRIDTLRALSVTCKALRAFALPLAWARIDACSSKLSNRSGDPGANKDVASQLARQLTIVTMKRSGLAHHVKIVYLEVVREAASEKGLSRLANALASFVNLHSICIKESSHRRDFSAAPFSGKLFPRVKRLIVSERLLPLLQCCPSVTYVNLTDRFSYRNIRGIGSASNYVLANCGKEVEEFVPFQAIFDGKTESFAQAVPNLKVLNLFEMYTITRYLMPLEDVQHFNKLTSLQCVRFFAQDSYADSRPEEEYDSDDSFDLKNDSNRASVVYYETIEMLRRFPPPLEGEHRCVIVSIQDFGDPMHEVISGECLNAEDCKFYRETPLLEEEVRRY